MARYKKKKGILTSINKKKEVILADTMLSPTINNTTGDNSDSAYFSASLGDSCLKKKRQSQDESTPKSSLPKDSNNQTRKRLLFINNLINEFNQTIFSMPSFECVVCRGIFYVDKRQSEFPI